MQQLSIAARPRTLDGLIGQEKTVENIRGHIANGAVIKAWMFSGPKGTGKTSISRILALSLQCDHSDVFGRPCKACSANVTSFPIYQIPAASISGKDGVRDALAGVHMGIMGIGKYRVYILDEAHALTTGAQDLLLDLFEDTPESTVFILCSTAPHSLKETLRSRCIGYEMRDLDYDNTVKLIDRLLKRVSSDLPADRLADALIEKGVFSPRLICQAVEKYYTGQSPEDAAKVDAGANVDIHALIRALIKGVWSDVAMFLSKSQAVSARDIRLSLMGYLRTMLLESPMISERTTAVASAIKALASVQNAEDTIIAGSVAAECYKMCIIFERYKH